MRVKRKRETDGTFLLCDVPHSFTQLGARYTINILCFDHCGMTCLWKEASLGGCCLHRRLQWSLVWSIRWHQIKSILCVLIKKFQDDMRFFIGLLERMEHDTCCSTSGLGGCFALWRRILVGLSPIHLRHQEQDTSSLLTQRSKKQQHLRCPKIEHVSCL